MLAGVVAAMMGGKGKTDAFCFAWAYYESLVRYKSGNLEFDNKPDNYVASERAYPS